MIKEIFNRKKAFKDYQENFHKENFQLEVIDLKILDH